MRPLLDQRIMAKDPRLMARDAFTEPPSHSHSQRLKEQLSRNGGLIEWGVGSCGDGKAFLDVESVEEIEKG
jgi:hypothetical protein